MHAVERERSLGRATLRMFIGKLALSGVRHRHRSGGFLSRRSPRSRPACSAHRRCSHSRAGNGRLSTGVCRARAHCPRAMCAHLRVNVALSILIARHVVRCIYNRLESSCRPDRLPSENLQTFSLPPSRRGFLLRSLPASDSTPRAISTHSQLRPSLAPAGRRAEYVEVDIWIIPEMPARTRVPSLLHDHDHE